MGTERKSNGCRPPCIRPVCRLIDTLLADFAGSGYRQSHTGSAFSKGERDAGDGGGESGLELSIIDLGCMSTGYAYGVPPDGNETINLIRSAVEPNNTFLGAAEVYGLYANNEH